MVSLPRSSGLLLHVTSLPSPYGIGDFGPAAYAFADFLVKSGQRVWQVLPLVPVAEGYSPYASPSTFATNPLLISLDGLRDAGLLTDADLERVPDFPSDHAAFDRAVPFKMGLLTRAYRRFADGASDAMQQRFDAFRAGNRAWLDDYALFMALKEGHGGRAWTDWAPELAAYNRDAVEAAHATHADAVQMHRFWQFVASEQWQALKRYCNDRGLLIFGDLPIYVAHDSADVWSNRDLFHLDEDGQPTIVAGVPPDYFSATGQRWGNPIYRWETMRLNGYAWWTARLRAVLEQVDICRLDHFRGFEAYWAIPADEETAVNGQWVDGPGADFFATIRQNLGSLPIVAEDLGIITEGVTALMQQFDLPGMAVLQFAFGTDDTNSFLPHNFKENLVAYTGTHDNDTIAGWWRASASTQDAEAAAQERASARAYLDITPEREDAVHWVFIEALLASKAQLTVFPVQDVLGLGSEARMNTPGSNEDNWAWRVAPGALTDDLAQCIRHLSDQHGR